MTIDRPFVREYTQCPFCGKDKPHMALSCWVCFNEMLKDGADDEAELILEEAEKQHREDNSQFGVGS